MPEIPEEKRPLLEEENPGDSDDSRPSTPRQDPDNSQLQEEFASLELDNHDQGRNTDQAPQPAADTHDQETVEYNKKQRWIYIVLIILGVLAGGGFRGVFSVKRWLVIHECHNNTTSKSFEDVHEDAYYKFTAALYGLFALLHAVAVAVIVKQYFRREWITMKINDKSYWKCAPYFILCFLLIWSVATSSIGLIFDLLLDHCYRHKWFRITSVCGYHIMVFFTTLVTSTVLYQLVFATWCVRHLWNEPKSVKVSEKYTNYCEGKFDEQRASLFYSEVCYNYHERGNKVTSFTSTFEAWFVLQWFIYFLSIFTDLTYVVRPWIVGGDVHHSVMIYKQHGHEYGYLSLFIVYDIMVFIIPFACGLIMNKYHHQYYSKLVKENELNFINSDQVDRAALWYASRTALRRVQKVKKFDFTPSILGVEISLTNPGYILSIVLAMVALILGFLVKPLNIT